MSNSTGLEQTFKSKDGVDIALKDFLAEGDFWELKRKGQKAVSVRHILTHDAIKKIADAAGVSRLVTYRLLTAPADANNYHHVFEVTICLGGECTTEIGEANKFNVGTNGRYYLASMASKRGYDRAVLRLLGLSGLLSEEEMYENTDDKHVDNLTPDEQKVIAKLVNMILNAKNVKDLAVFNKKMKEVAGEYSKEQLTVLRRLFKNKHAEFVKTF